MQIRVVLRVEALAEISAGSIRRSAAVDLVDNYIPAAARFLPAFLIPRAFHNILIFWNIVMAAHFSHFFLTTFTIFYNCILIHSSRVNNISTR